jgi:hypothetical protein
MKISKEIILGIVLVCFVLVASGCISSDSTSDNTSSDDNTSNDNSSSDDKASSNDVTIDVKYSGPWAADVSGEFGYRSLSGTGNQKNSLGSVSGPITVSARKTEGGSGTLTVSILKGKETLSSASTSSPWGAATATFTG